LSPPSKDKPIFGRFDVFTPRLLTIREDCNIEFAIIDLKLVLGCNVFKFGVNSITGNVVV
jgi:hypothetical protein